MLAMLRRICRASDLIGIQEILKTFLDTQDPGPLPLTILEIDNTHFQKNVYQLVVYTYSGTVSILHIITK